MVGLFDFSHFVFDFYHSHVLKTRPQIEIRKSFFIRLDQLITRVKFLSAVNIRQPVYNIKLRENRDLFEDREVKHFDYNSSRMISY